MPCCATCKQRGVITLWDLDTARKLAAPEAVLAEGEASQINTRRWMDYAQTAVDPGDDRTIWYVGDYLKAGGTNYSTRIGAFRLGK